MAPFTCRLFICAATMFAVGQLGLREVVKADETPPLSAGAVVAALDEQLQLRFVDETDQRFGMSRLCPDSAHKALTPPKKILMRYDEHRLHMPEMALPGAAAWPMARCGMQDWVPLETRNPQEAWVVRETARAKVEVWTMLAGVERRGLQGPVVLGAANPVDLNTVRTQLLARIQDSSISEKPIADWNVVVKAVRASRDSCLGCHPRSKKGDPIGYLVYLHRAQR